MLVERVDHDAERHVALVLGAAALEHQQPGVARAVAERGQQRGLADPRLADDAEHAARAAAHVVECVRHHGELGIAPDQVHVI